MFGIAGKAALPECVAQNDNEVFSILLFFWSKNPSQEGRAFHHLEETIAHLNCRNSFRFRFARHDWKPAGEGCHFFEDT